MRSNTTRLFDKFRNTHNESSLQMPLVTGNHSQASGATSPLSNTSSTHFLASIKKSSSFDEQQMGGDRKRKVPTVLEKDVSKWSCQDVCIWLECLKLSHLQKTFFQNSISGEELLELTDGELLSGLNVRDENERRLIRELRNNREMWMHRIAILNSPSPGESPTSPIMLNPVVSQSFNQQKQGNALTAQSLKHLSGPTKSIGLELDELSDVDDVTSVGGFYESKGYLHQNNGFAPGSTRMKFVLDYFYSDSDDIKFKVFGKNHEIHLITRKKADLSFSSLKLEIIERYQCVKPLIRYRDADGDLIRISKDEDLAHVIHTYFSDGGDKSQPIKLQVDVDTSVAVTEINPVTNFNSQMQSQSQRIIQLEEENIEKGEIIQNLELRLSAQRLEQEKQFKITQSLQEEISTLKMELLSLKSGSIFNPGSLSHQEVLLEYSKLIKSLHNSLQNAQNSLFDLIDANK